MLSTLSSTSQLICIKWGETGYYPSEWDTGGKKRNVELADELNNEYTVTLCGITQETDYALKSIYELRAQVTKLAEILDKPHNVLMTVPKRDVFVKDTKCFPGFGHPAKNACLACGANPGKWW